MSGLGAKKSGPPVPRRGSDLGLYVRTVSVLGLETVFSLLSGAI